MHLKNPGMPQNSLNLCLYSYKSSTEQESQLLRGMCSLTCVAVESANITCKITNNQGLVNECGTINTTIM